MAEHGLDPEGKARDADLILAADDEAPVLDLTCRMLERLGYRVVAARDSAEALALFEQYRGSLAGVLLDLVMPGSGSEKLLARIRHRDRELPILISSGHPEREVSDLLAADVRLGFLQKPFSLSTLASKLRELTGSSVPGGEG